MSIELAAVLITAFVSIGGSWLVGVSSRSRESALLRVAYERITSLERRIDQLEVRLNRAHVLIEDRDAYIYVLRKHIWDRLPPPPPERPAVLDGPDLEDLYGDE